MFGKKTSNLGGAAPAQKPKADNKSAAKAAKEDKVDVSAPKKKAEAENLKVKETDISQAASAQENAAAMLAGLGDALEKKPDSVDRSVAGSAPKKTETRKKNESESSESSKPKA